ncbi:MAG: NAD(P)/FAD-dependent oxidoreductase [Bacteriovoracaceae bacterium]|nr:NAD(P)/FAD-dependent oxidoreductase [Bacteriovoracaceae bacterium]
MPKTLSFTLNFQQDVDAHVRSLVPGVRDYRVISKSLDARGAPRGRIPQFHYTVEALLDSNDHYATQSDFKKFSPLKTKPIIIGAGPAGLFCAVMLAEHGIPSLIIERGESADKRMLKIAKFWRQGELDPDTNVCYGEGGAGLYSDGKLITRVKSSHIPYVMRKLVEFGAPEEVSYISNPHLGSNKIRQIISQVSGWLQARGSEMRYNTCVEKLIYRDKQVVGVELRDGEKIYSDHVVLAAGHSAQEMYQHLHESGVELKTKDFAVGVRIEHTRRHIDKIQHGQWCEAPELGAARYRLSWHDHTADVGVYSFCMCPGGYVLSSGTEKDGLVVNGMSNFARNSYWSNAALVVTVKTSKLAEKDMMAGLRFQHNIEKLAFQSSQKHATGREIPSLTIREFLNGRLDSNSLPKTSCPSQIFKADLRDFFPDEISKHLAQGLEQFEKTLPGFTKENALLLAPETRTSSPLTIVRNRETLLSSSHGGLYPCGEGAGYAGGITSAAVDGVRVAYAILTQENLLPPVSL